MTTTTQRLPIEALGDRDLVDRLSKLPKDKQPFWLLNWQALEEQRKNPQTYPQRPSHFSQPLNPSFSGSISTSNGPGSTSDNQFNSGTPGSNFNIGTSGFASGNTNTNNNNFVVTNSSAGNSGPSNVASAPFNSASNSEFENRFGNDDTTQLTAGHVLTPTYPIYAHVDDVLGNNYVPSHSSQSQSLKSDSGSKLTVSSNKPDTKNLTKRNRKLALQDSAEYEDTRFFYAPSLPMFKEPIFFSSSSSENV